MGSKRLTPTRVGKNGLKMFVIVVVVVDTNLWPAEVFSYAVWHPRKVLQMVFLNCNQATAFPERLYFGK